MLARPFSKNSGKVLNGCTVLSDPRTAATHQSATSTLPPMFGKEQSGRPGSQSTGITAAHDRFSDRAPPTTAAL
jgi:hypothetical protein